MSEAPEIKCVVWDLDNTLWSGVLLENDEVTPRPEAMAAIRTLDTRGILQSIASRGDAELSLDKLAELGLKDYFLYPQIGWDAKSASVARIREHLNIGLDTMLFVDDQPFERDEVRHTHPEVTCVDAAAVPGLPDQPRLNPRFITAESSRRRAMYQADIVRGQAEAEHQGPKQAFLAGLGMRCTIAAAAEDDLQRAVELTERTNQLNSTGRAYDYDALRARMDSPDHDLLVCELTDRYGSYGKIGLALVERQRSVHHLRLLLMSCRVMNRGVGTIVLSHILQAAARAGAAVRADFRRTGRNRMMYVALKFAGFTEREAHGDDLVLEHDGSAIQAFPPYVDVTVPPLE